MLKVFANFHWAILFMKIPIWNYNEWNLYVIEEINLIVAHYLFFICCWKVFDTYTHIYTVFRESSLKLCTVKVSDQNWYISWLLYQVLLRQKSMFNAAWNLRQNFQTGWRSYRNYSNQSSRFQREKEINSINSIWICNSLFLYNETVANNL